MGISVVMMVSAFVGIVVSVGHMRDLEAGSIAGQTIRALERHVTPTYGGGVIEHEGVTMDDRKKSRDQGRLRLRRPTFRGSSVGWGLAAVLWLSCAVPALIRVVHFGGTSVGGVVLLAALVVASAICVVGTVVTIRHPRPAPPAVDS